ncbi:MAG: LysR family transcriptional regulator [Saccharofermentanales bacterium]
MLYDNKISRMFDISDAKSMNVNPELYKVFYFVAKQGSVSGAAAQLFISQPAVSRTIRQLEDKMGCMLFFRTSRGVSLTKEGEMLFTYVEMAFNFLFIGEKKLAQIKNLSEGELSLGVGDSICKHYLIPYLKKFNTKNPGVSIHITNQKSYEIVSLLKAGKIDLGLVNLPLDDDQLRITKVMDIHDCFVVGEKYKYLTNAKITLRSLTEFPLMLVEKGSNSRRFIEDFFQNHKIRLVPDFELGNFELLSQFAMINLGIACVIKEFFLQELDTRQLFEISLKEEIPARGIGVASLQMVPLSAAAKEFIYLLTNKN